MCMEMKDEDLLILAGTHFQFSYLSYYFLFYM